MFFFFKQKTAYGMRISDWSSDVCSSDLPQSDVPGEQSWPTQPFPTAPPPLMTQGVSLDDAFDLTPESESEARAELGKYRLGPLYTPPSLEEIGRASCRERVCQFV